jgi:hypothetical protein
MNPFWIGGPLLFLWALFLAFALGMRSEGFPRDDGQMKLVMGISILLTAIAISCAVIGGITGAGADKGLRKGAEVQHSQ